VVLSGTNEVINPSVTASSPGFAGANIISAGAVSITSSGVTRISDGSGGLVVSSNKNLLAGDVKRNYTGITTSNLFSSFFNASKATIQAGADVVFNSTITNLSTLNGYAGQTVWVNGNIKASGTAVIGTASNPAVLIVNGNIIMNTTGTNNALLTVYGILYVTGSINTNPKANKGIVINGQIASEGSFTTAGDGTINFNSAVLAALGARGAIPTNYSNSQIGYPQEVFP
jgi:hypothetical protein